MAKHKKPSNAEIAETLLADKKASEDTKRLIEKDEREERALLLKETNALLKEIQSPFVYKPKELSEEKVNEISLKKMSRYARAFNNFKGVAGTAMQVSGAVVQVGESIDDLHHTPQNVELAHGFHIGAIALTVINFFRIPTMYLFGRLMGQPVPFTLSDGLRFGYSTLLLALTITALAAPITAPYIAFISAGIGLGLSTYFIGKLAYERYQLAKQEKSLNQEIKTAEGKLDEMRGEAAELEQVFSHNERDSVVLARIDDLKQRYDEHLLHMQGLYDKRAQNEQLIAKFSKSNVLFRTVSLFLAALTIAGLVVALFFPPTGLGILAGVALTSSAIVMGKLGLSVVQWVRNKWNASANPEPEAAANRDGKDLQVEMSPNKTVRLDSVAKAFSALNAAEKSYAAVAADNGLIAAHRESVVEPPKEPVTAHLDQPVSPNALRSPSSPRFFSIAPPVGEGLEMQEDANASLESGEEQLLQR